MCVCVFVYLLCVMCGHTYTRTAGHGNLCRAFGLESFPFKEWLVVDLDFSALGIRQCARTDNIDITDYTELVPTDEVCMYT